MKYLCQACHDLWCTDKTDLTHKQFVPCSQLCEKCIGCLAVVLCGHYDWRQSA